MPLSLGVASGASNLKNPAEPFLLKYRTNMITNPSFEVDTTGWTSVAGATLTRSTSEFYTGSASLRVANSSQSAAQFDNGGQMIPLNQGEGTYFISAYVKLDAGATTANYFLRFLQYVSQGGSTVGTGNVGTLSLSPAGGWTRLSGSFTKVGIANFAAIRVVTSSTTPTDIFYVDAVMLEKSSTLKPYFDGSSANSFWSGTPHASISATTPY